MAHAWNACWVHALGGSNPPSSASRSHRPLDETGFLSAQNMHTQNADPGLRRSSPLKGDHTDHNLEEPEPREEGFFKGSTPGEETQRKFAGKRTS